MSKTLVGLNRTFSHCFANGRRVGKSQLQFATEDNILSLLHSAYAESLRITLSGLVFFFNAFLFDSTSHSKLYNGTGFTIGNLFSKMSIRLILTDIFE